MIIKLAHHFWEKNENATWRPMPFPYPDIEDEIKKDYVFLEAKRPKWKQYGNITAFFDYRPAKDIYGRDIVPISFAFIANCKRPEACHSTIASRLANARTEGTYFEVDIPEANLKVRSKKRNISGSLKVSIMVLIVICLWLFMSREKNHLETSHDPGNSEVAQNGRAQIVDSERSHVQQTQEKAMPEKKILAMCTPATTPDPAKSEFKICKAESELYGMLTECAKGYFSKICSGKTALEIGYPCKDDRNGYFKGGSVASKIIKEVDAEVKSLLKQNQLKK